MRVSVAPLASCPLPVDNKKAPPHQRGGTNKVLFSSEPPTSKDVLGAGREGRPRLLGATLAKRVSAE